MSDTANKAANALVLLISIGALIACSPRSEPPRHSTNTDKALPQSDNEDVHALSIGTFSGLALRDGTLEFTNDNKIFGVGRTRAEVSTLLTAANLSADELELSIQPLLVKTANRILLFDTGAGANMGSSAGRLPASMTTAGVDRADVTDIFISHAHGDHVGGLINAEGALSFPNATIHISSPEWAFLKGMDAAAAANVAIARHAILVDAMAPKVAEFAPDADLIPGAVRAVEIRGHTPGHSGYLISSGQESLLYIADAMHHVVISVQKPDWIISFDADAETAAASRRELLARSATNEQRIYAVHFPFPGLGAIEGRSDGFAWIPE